MKTTTKIIFSAALMTFALGVASPQAWAAERITPNANFEVQLNQDVTNNITNGVDPHFYKFNMNFSIGGGVGEGDYFDIETHALPLMNGLDIKSGADDIVIGQMSVVERIGATRDVQYGLPADWQDLPLNGYGSKYRITFNNNVVGRNNIKFSINNIAQTISATIADRSYEIESWVKINDTKAFSKNFTVTGFGRDTKYQNAMWFDKSVLNTDNSNMYISVGICMTDNNMTGGKVNLSLRDNPYYKFITQPYDSKQYNGGSNFFFDDTSSVNQYGAIFSDLATRKWSYEEKLQNDKDIEFVITSKTDGNICSGLWSVYIELTDEGKQYFAKNNKMPSVDYSAKILRTDNSEAFSSILKGDVITIGTSASFFSRIKEEAKKIEESEKLEPSKIEEKSPEIKAPNTGFEGETSALALTGFSLLGVATFFARKR